MSPRTDPRAASLGSDPTELSALLARSLGEAQNALQDEARMLRGPRPANDRTDDSAVVRRELREAATAWSSLAQACATGLLAARAAALVAAIEADNATGHLVFPSVPVAPLPQDAYCPRCGHPRGFSRTCNSPDGGSNGPRCGCGNQFHASGVR